MFIYLFRWNRLLKLFSFLTCKLRMHFAHHSLFTHTACSCGNLRQVTQVSLFFFEKVTSFIASTLPTYMTVHACTMGSVKHPLSSSTPLPIAVTIYLSLSVHPWKPVKLSVSFQKCYKILPVQAEEEMCYWLCFSARTTKCYIIQYNTLNRISK